MSQKNFSLSDEFTRERRYDEWLEFFFPTQMDLRDPSHSIIRVRELIFFFRNKTEDFLAKRTLLGSRVLAKFLEYEIKKISDSGVGLYKIPILHYAGVDDFQYEISMEGLDRQLRNFLLKNGRKIPMTTAILLVVYMLDNNFLPVMGVARSGDRSEGMLADALNQFFGSSRRTIKELPIQFQGDFFLYRYSMHWPGRYVKALLNIEAIELGLTEGFSSGVVLRTTEKHIHHGVDGSSPAEEVYVGVLSRKSGYPFILSSLTNEDRMERGAPRFTLIHSTIYSNGSSGPVSSMTGISVSPFGRMHAWTLPVCIERSPREIIDTDLGIFSDTELDPVGMPRIPKSVIARLQRLTELKSEF